MASRVVGLDIGTHAVRAAELSLGRDGATVENFAQVALPPGAVRDGEVVDVAAVSTALRRLWSEGGFKIRDVFVGVGNQRVIVRQADLPDMSEEDLRSALQFEAAELIPIPIDEALLDFQILSRFTGMDQGEERPLMRILLVAAQRDMVRSLLAAVDGAGLRPTLVDVVPFALLRSLGATANDLLSDRGPAEAIVCIGSGVTNVVVHERGVPRFVRMLIVGGSTITDAIAAELGVDADGAEDLKRRADVRSLDSLEARAGRVVGDKLTPLLEEIRGSLDYYLAQSDAAPIGRVLVTGGGSRLGGLAERLHDLVGLPVEPAHPLLGVRIGRTGLTEPELIEAEPLLSVPIGLALAGRPPEDGLRRMTLLPREVAVVREQRRLAGLVGAGVGGLAVVLVGLWALQGSQVHREAAKASEAEARVSRLQTQVAALQSAADLDVQLQQRRQLVTAALSDDVAWTRLFEQIATVIPNDVWLTSFSGTKAVSGTAAAGAPATFGQVSIGAKGFDHTSAARWLLRAGDLPSIGNLWLSSSSKGGGANSLVTFQSTGTLTDKSRSDRTSHYTGNAQ